MNARTQVSLSSEIEALKALYAAINRDDIPAAVKYFDPHIERIEPEGFPSSGTYRGVAEVQAHLAQGRGTWAEGSCDPESFSAIGDKLVAHLHVRVRLKNRSEWIDARFADGFMFRDGRVILMRTFADSAQALAWANAADFDKSPC